MKKQTWKQSIIRFLSAQTISLFGSSLVQYAIVWYITLTTSSGKMLTISTLCAFLPQIIISLFAGVWIDHYHRQTIIMLSDAMIAIATLLLAITFFAGYQNIWFLFLVLVIRSFGTGIQTPAVNAIIPQIVPIESLMKINSINSTLSSCMMFLSPAISGALLSFTRIEVIMLIDVITAIIGISITATVKIFYEIKTEKKTDTISDIKASLTYLQQKRSLLYMIIFQFIILFLISPSAFLTPLMVSRTFGLEVWRLTVSEMTYSLGMVLGGIIMTSWGGFHNKMLTTLFASICYGTLMIGLGIAPIFVIYLLCNTLIGITSPCYNTPITVTVQTAVEPQMQGRIFSLMQISSSCALPLGMMLFGPLGDLFHVQFLLISAGSLVIIVTMFIYFKGFIHHL